MGEWKEGYRKEKVVAFVTIWMAHDNIVPGEISQAEKDKCCMTLLTCGI